MLKIRLQRTGKRNQASFRVVVGEHTKKPKGKVLELLGNYNPHQKKLAIKKDRIEYWISKGAQVSPTVNNLMVNHKIWDKPKMKSWKPKSKKNFPDQTDGGGEKEKQGTVSPEKKQEQAVEPKAEEPKKEESAPEEKPKEEAVQEKTEQKEE